MAGTPESRFTRRSFVGGVAAAFAAFRGGMLADLIRRRAELDATVLGALARCVLPAELGTAGADRAAAAFVSWARGYKPGAELSHGYGNARIRTSGGDPSIRWALQLGTLDADAQKAHGRTFAALTDDERRAIVRTQLSSERATNMGSVAGASHVAVALLAHFYESPEATDLCYEAHIGKNSCRPLSTSSSRPVALMRNARSSPSPIPDPPSPW